MGTSIRFRYSAETPPRKRVREAYHVWKDRALLYEDQLNGEKHARKILAAERDLLRTQMTGMELRAERKNATNALRSLMPD
jgi:hypothetical protein